MQSAVVDIGRHGGNIAFWISVGFLLVANEVLGAGHNSSSLDSIDGLVHQGTGEIWVDGKS